MPFHPHQPPRQRRPRTEADPAPTAAQVPAAAATGPLLYTPAEAARLLKVRESWLRKKAAARQVPRTFLGRHLRFSATDLAAIVTTAAQPAVGRRPRRRAPTVRDPDLIRPAQRSVDPPRPDDHNTDGSSPWPG
jgi:excisionase family DNA binding protein